MQAGLVRERRYPHVRLVGIGSDVGQLGEGVRDTDQVGKVPGRKDASIELGLQVPDDGEEIGVACSFAVPVGGALRVGGAGLDCREGVGDCAASVVLAVNAEPGRPASRENLGHHSVDPHRKHSAVGVTEDANLSPR